MTLVVGAALIISIRVCFVTICTSGRCICFLFLYFCFPPYWGNWLELVAGVGGRGQIICIRIFLYFSGGRCICFVFLYFLCSSILRRPTWTGDRGGLIKARVFVLEFVLHFSGGRWIFFVFMCSSLLRRPTCTGGRGGMIKARVFVSEFVLYFSGGRWNLYVSMCSSLLRRPSCTGGRGGEWVVPREPPQPLCYKWNVITTIMGKRNQSGWMPLLSWGETFPLLKFLVYQNTHKQKTLRFVVKKTYICISLGFLNTNM